MAHNHIKNKTSNDSCQFKVYTEWVWLKGSKGVPSTKRLGNREVGGQPRGGDACDPGGPKGDIESYNVMHVPYIAGTYRWQILCQLKGLPVKFMLSETHELYLIGISLNSMELNKGIKSGC